MEEFETEKIIISVIIPIFRSELFIRKCLESLFSNSIAEKCEFILIDDCSPDNSIHIAKSIAGDFPKLDIKFILNEKNLRSAGTRKVGINIANGKYICFVDSDDWVEITYLEELYKQAEKFNADVVGCDFYFDNSISVKIEFLDDINNDVNIENILSGKLDGYLWIKLIKKSLLVKYNISFTDGIDLWEDVLFSSILFTKVNRFSYVNKPLYHYRKNNNSLVNSFSEKKLKDIILAVEEIEKFFFKELIYEQYESSLKMLKARAKILLLSKCPKKLEKEFVNIYGDINSLIMKVECAPYHNKLIAFFSVHGLLIIADFIKSLSAFWRKIKLK